jgi:hypothetical protein
MELLMRDRDPEGFMEAEAESAPSYVRPVPHLGSDLVALMELKEPMLPHQRVIHYKAVLQVGYGFGDAIGNFFGSIIQLNDEIMWRAGQCVEFYEKECSNRHELENIVITLEGHVRYHDDSAVEFFMFTNNFVTECAYLRGTSTSPILFELVLRLWELELSYGGAHPWNANDISMLRWVVSGGEGGA